MVSPKIKHPRPKRAGSNSTMGERTAERVHRFLAAAFGGRRIFRLVGVVVIALVIAGCVFWYNKVYSDPKDVFWGMISNNLSTYSVTKNAGQNSGGSQNDEVTQLSFTPVVAVRDVKEIQGSQNGTSSHIKIESIGTPTNTYQHYALIEQSSSGKPSKDFSAVYPLWLKNSGNTQPDSSLFSNTIFSALLFGNLTPTQRASAVNDLHNAYTVDFNSVKKTSDHGRKTYAYKVKVNLGSYAKAAKAFAKTQGLPNANQIDPTGYKATDQISVIFSVDVLSRQLRTVEYVGSGATEHYTTYGVITHFAPPHQTVSYQTLQQAVQKAASQ